MTLAELLENRFRGDVRFRGDAYLKAERVAITRITPETIFGIVRDGVEYQTRVSREDDDVKMYCTCKLGSKPNAACKHLWATVLAVDESGVVGGAIAPGKVPPFISEPEPIPLDADWDDDDLDADVYHPPVESANGRRPHVQTRLRPWEASLAGVREKMKSAEPAAPSAGREREILYEIDVAESQNAGRLIIQTSQRQRRANGQWGKLKPLKLRPGRLEEIEREDDGRILAYLSGGTPDRNNWHAKQTELQSAVHRYQVPYELCELILPLMCRTERVLYLEDPGKNSPPLAWDEGPPWELAMRMVEDADADHWRLEGRLQREDESMSTADAVLLLPGGLVLTHETIARLEDFDAFEWTTALENDAGLSVPDGEEHEFVDGLLDMPSLPRLELPEKLKLEEVTCEPVPFLTIRSPKGGRWRPERLQADLEFDYDGVLVSGGSARWAIVQREQNRCLLRNRAHEERAWGRLQENGFRRLLDTRRSGHDVEIFARDLGSAVRSLIADGWRVHADGKQVRQAGDVAFSVKSGIDWFELHANVNFDGRTVAFPELLSALNRGDGTVRLDDGSLGIVPEEWAQQFGLLSGLGVAEDEHVRFAGNQVALLDALLAAHEQVDYDDEFLKIRERIQNFGGVKTHEAPDGFHGELRPYQCEGLGWLQFLHDFRLGGCLADDMGLGKTIQVLAQLLERRKHTKTPTPSLIVVPKSLLFNWRRECERFTPELTSLEYTGTDRAALRDEFSKHDLILTTYGTLRRDVLELKECEFDYVVLDEAQTIKNSGSQTAKAARLLQAQHRLALSGTPIENHLGDLWSIFEFLNPGMLGRSALFKSFAADAESDKSQQLLSQGLRPFILRRTKKQVAADLPEKMEETIFCEMGEEQRRLYEELRDHYRQSLLGMVEDQGLNKSKMHVLEALLRLRQAACHPALLDRSETAESSAKLDVLCPHIQELITEGHKALIFSQFTSMLAIVKEHFDRMGVDYEYLDGKTRRRQEHIDRFQNDPDCGAFLISLKAGGLGLNLTAADYVFLLDPWWNPAVETQAIDRAHRVGQTRQVFAYRLICRDTVEEKIAELQKKKRKLADAILEADGSLLRDLSTEDLEMLLS